MLTATFGTVARLLGPALEPDERLRRAVAYLDLPISAPLVVRVGYAAGCVVGLAGLPVVVLIPTALPLVIAGAIATVHAVHGWPPLHARLHRSRAAGESASLVGRLTLRLAVEPSPERAADVAAGWHGPLGDSLADHVRRARGTPRTGLRTFADEWDPWAPALARAVRSAHRATTVPPDERIRTLDRARTAVREGHLERAVAEAGALQGPVTALYAFGVVLPLALVGILPAAMAAGLSIPGWVLVTAYDVVLPLGLLWGAIAVLARRPSPFPAAPVGVGHPDVPDRRLPGTVAGVGVAVLTVLVVPFLLPGWARWPAALGWGIGTALVVMLRPMRPVRARVRAVESSLPDALTFVGNRVGDGTSVERAVERAGESVGGATGEVFAAVARRQRLLGVDVQDALLGRDGVLATVPSRRTRDAARLLCVAARVGRPAGDVVTSLGEHLDELRRIEQEASAALRRVTDTLSHTAMGFGPAVAGATVALADRMTATAAVGAAPNGIIGPAVGVYVVISGAVLAGLATGLDRGLDPSLLGLRVGRTLVAAPTVFLVAFVGARALT